jgi:hypothetical protein
MRAKRARTHQPAKRIDMSTVIFTRRGDIYTVRFRYDPELVELLKDVVPSYARSWTKTTKEWTVHIEYAEQLAAAIRQLGHQVIGFDPPKINDHTNTDPFTALFHHVGPNRVDPVHRALTRVLHPDTDTGDTRLQQELNDARAELDRGGDRWNVNGSV